MIVERLAGVADEEVRRLGVDRRHLAILGLGRFDHRLAEHLAEAVDAGLDPAEQLFGLGRRLAISTP
ncbi:MAG: hypothetical protein AAGK09_04415 [Planctomycetota bacterium]